jgi:PadR family transcriptional regulator, regulatory protein PadR
MKLSALEQHVLTAIIALHPNGYGVSIQNHIKRQTGSEPSIGSVYAALDRLESNGFITSREGEKTVARRDHRKLYFTVAS